MALGFVNGTVMATFINVKQQIRGKNIEYLFFNA
jgi:hypothetical protein